MANLTDIRSNWSTGASEGGVTVYATKENLPTSGLTSGDQAYVTGNSRFYISNGSGWYNVALVNATPSLTIDPTGAIELSTAGTATTITLTATDSDNAVDGLTFSVESDGSFAGLASLSQDSSVFTITPLSEDSATTTSSILTFKASDGISFGSGDRTLTLEFKVQNSNYTTLLLQADSDGTDNQVDASSTGTTVIKVGNPTSTALTPYHPGGYSTYFDGTGDYMTIPHDTGFDFGTSDFTIEAWIYPTALSSNRLIVDTYNASQAGSYQLYWRSGGTSLAFYTQADGVVLQDPSGSNIQVNTWHHVAVTRSGSTFRMFVDGTQVNSTTFTRDLTHGIPVVIGYQQATSTNYFLGYIRDVRVVKGTAVYTSAFTPPTVPLTAITNTSLLTCHLPYIADGSSSSHSITVAGNTNTERFGPYDYKKYTNAGYGGSVYFPNNVANSYRVDGIAAFGTGDFTVEFWVRFNSQSASATLWDSRPTNGNGAYFLIANDATGNNGPSLYVNTAYRIQHGSNLPSNTWNHIAVSRVSGTTTMYINGISTGTWSDTTNYIAGASRPLIGRNGYSANSPLYGYISDVRSVKGTGVYTTNFTPPAAPLTDVTDTELLTFTNQNDIWDAGSGNLLTKTGDVTASNTQRKFATSSAVYFDGTGDYLSIADDITFHPSGDFTAECWIYPTASPAQPIIFGQWSNPYSWAIQLSNDSNRNARMIFHDGSFQDTVTGTAVALNTWTHLALVKNGSTATIYVNGVSAGTDTIGSLTNSTAALTLGATSSGGQPYSGYIQDARFTNGLARYTSNFTPPTSEFSG